MIDFLYGLELAVAIALSLLILLQQRSAGLGSMAGGGGGDIKTERRGGEKVLHQATIVLAVAFCSIAFIIPLVN